MDAWICPNNCGRKYKNKCHLSRHLKYECGVPKRFSCSMCNKRFAQRDSYRSHMGLKHGVIVDWNSVRHFDWYLPAYLLMPIGTCLSTSLVNFRIIFFHCMCFWYIFYCVPIQFPRLPVLSSMCNDNLVTVSNDEWMERTFAILSNIKNEQSCYFLSFWHFYVLPLVPLGNWWEISIQERHAKNDMSVICWPFILDLY